MYSSSCTSISSMFNVGHEKSNQMRLVVLLLPFVEERCRNGIRWISTSSLFLGRF